MSGLQTAPYPVAASPGVRRWIRRRRIAANGRVDPGTLYAAGLALAMAAALFGQPLLRVIWPARATHTDPIDVIAAVGLVLLVFFGLLRQSGPLVLSRSAATWLLPAPVPRPVLLAPALLSVATVAVLLGALTGAAAVGHLAPRPVPAFTLLTGVTSGAAAAVALALAAVKSQQRAAPARILDRCAAVIGGALLLVTVAARAPLAHPVMKSAAWPEWASTPISAAAALGLLALAFGGFVAVWRRLDRWPTHGIADASAITATYTDAVYALEPSFIAEMREREFWRRHPSFRPSPLIRSRRLPPLVAHDLLTLRRKARRIWWLAGTALAPALVADQARWLLLGVLLLGALGAATFTTHPVHTDTRNPALQRLLGLSTRQLLGQRLVVPTLVAAGWLVLAMAVLLATGAVDSTGWLALGVVASPAVAVAALQRARAGDIGMLLIDTPLGAFPAGLLLWLLNGVDVLALLTLPVSVPLAQDRAPGWLPLLLQAAVSASGVVVLLWRANRRSQAL